MTRIQTPPGTSEVSHAGQPYPIDPHTGQFDVPDEVAPHFLRLEGFREVPVPAVTPEPKTTRAAAKAAPSQEE